MNKLLKILQLVYLVNRQITRGFIEKKTGVQILNEGKDFGEIVTNVDVGISQALLDGVADMEGFRKRYPGSFSEEQDSPLRTSSLLVRQVDPVDGTGDFADTYSGNNVMSPTTLISLLERQSVNDPFKPVGGIIFDIVHNYALVGNGSSIGLYCFDGTGKMVRIPIKRISPTLTPDSPIYVGRRTSYPQLAFDGPFKDYVRSKGVKLVEVPCGGAGEQALRFLRSYIKPNHRGEKSFTNLQPLSLIFNAQPDWKTWDTDPLLAISTRLGCVTSCNIFGDTIRSNASNPTLKDMHHTQGFVFGESGITDLLCSLARDFTDRNPDCSLLQKNYDFKNAIVKMAK